MTDDHEKDKALRAALDDDADQEVSPAARQAAARDIAAIRRGLTLLADQANRPAPARTGAARRRARRRLTRPVVAVPAVAALLVAGVLSWPKGGTEHVTARPPTPGTAQSPEAPNMPPQRASSLPEQVTAAERIVVGAVTDVQVADARHVLARIRVTQRIKGPAGDVVALAASGTPWRAGERLLVFLKPDSGPSAALRPRHLRVTDDHSGWYVMRGDTVAGAGFTLADVEKLAGP
jgi:hypothetical protein